MRPIPRLLEQLDDALTNETAWVDLDYGFAVVTGDPEVRFEINGPFASLVVQQETNFRLSLRDRLDLWCFRWSVTREYRRTNTRVLPETFESIHDPQ